MLCQPGTARPMRCEQAGGAHPANGAPLGVTLSEEHMIFDVKYV